MTKLSFVLLLLTMACTSEGSSPRAQPAAPGLLATPVDSIFRDIQPDAPGCAVGVYRDGDLLLARSYGVANVEDGRPITSNTTFDLGSVSKQFTALAALMLEEQRRLQLDDDVRRYVPELPDYGTPIRIRDLLQHTSGLRDYGTLDVLAGRETRTMSELLALLSRQQRLNFTPGTRHEYSHSDFELLGLVIERIVGEPFGAYLEREVLRPLGMVNSRLVDHRGARVPERAYGHAQVNDSFRVVFNSSEVVGGSNLYTSIADLKHWDRALADGASGKRPLVARMLTRPTLPSGDTIPYAYGIRKESRRGLPTFERGGRSYGIRTEIIRFPEQQLAVAALCNGYHLWAGNRAERVASVYLDSLMQPRPADEADRPPAAVPISEAELQQFVGNYHAQGSLDHVRIAVRNGQLVELLGDTAQSFTYRGESVFTGDGITGDIRLAFSRGASGAMQLQVLSGSEIGDVWARIADSALWRPDSSDLAEYAGTYFSDELNAVWQLAVANGDLVLRRPGMPDGSMQAMQRDVFSRHFGAWDEPIVASIAFTRDAESIITHFSVSTPPGSDVVRDLRFLRSRTR